MIDKIKEIIKHRLEGICHNIETNHTVDDKFNIECDIILNKHKIGDIVYIYLKNSGKIVKQKISKININPTTGIIYYSLLSLDPPVHHSNGLISYSGSYLIEEKDMYDNLEDINQELKGVL